MTERVGMGVGGATASAAHALARTDLAAAVRERDPAVLRAVVEDCLPQVLRAARGAGLSPQDAEDITQETFLKFLEISPRFEGRSHVRTFLLGILCRKISEARRGFARERQHDPIDEAIEGRFAADGRWIRPPEAADALVRLSGRVSREIAEISAHGVPPARSRGFSQAGDL